jgi:6-phosphogluconolactonase
MRSPRTLIPILAAMALLVMAPGAASAGDPGGAVFTMSNDPGGNRVLIWERSADGSLHGAGSAATAGTGMGGLGNQGAVTLTRNHRWLYVVNPGSDEISVFRVHGTHLKLMEVAPSGGDMPISVTASGRVVYVLNAGGDGNIAGHWRGPGGILTPIAGSVEPLSQAGGTDPAQIGFAPGGEHLVVTEKATNRITFYAVDASGAAGAPDWRGSSTDTPFGFAFTRHGIAVVSEAAGGAPDASATSSYRFRANGTLKIVDGSVATTETAACWVALARNDRFAYVTNTGSGTISGYSVSAGGDLSLLDGNGVTASTGTGSAPIDAAVDGSNHMYVLLAGTDAIAILHVKADGSLVDMGQVSGLPDGANGLAAY